MLDLLLFVLCGLGQCFRRGGMLMGLCLLLRCFLLLLCLLGNVNFEIFQDLGVLFRFLHEFRHCAAYTVEAVCRDFEESECGGVLALAEEV